MVSKVLPDLTHTHLSITSPADILSLPTVSQTHWFSLSSLNRPTPSYLKDYVLLSGIFLLTL